MSSPSIVTIKVFSSGTPQVSLVNVMSVINNPEETTLRSVISSEIQAANNPTTTPSQLLASFDDKKHIASVETSGKTNIKQLLDLPMSILLKQQVGIQDGVINVTVDTPPSPIVNKPPHPSSSRGGGATSSSSSSRVIINNKNRTNPFNSSRQNFPPLEEFFRGSCGSSSSSPSPASSLSSRASMRSSLTSKTTTPLSSSPSPSKHHDFSLDMSIAGRAAMTQHRYQIEKYGIDGEDNDKISPLSEERDWDHLMDSSSSSPSNKSVALTDINNTLSLSRICESSILSPSIMTDVSGTGDSYFDKSIIEALKTPEKFAGRVNDNVNGIAHQQQQQVTLSRGQGNDLDYSDDENSICDDTSTHVTNTTNGSAGVGLNGIFRAAMKMHNNNGYDKKRDENESTVSTNVSMRSRGNNSKGRRKSLSVSFALDDESFAIEKHSSAKKAHQHRGIIGSNDEEEEDEFGEFLLSPIGKEENKDVTFCVDSSFIAHQSSPACSRVEGSCDETSPNVSPSASVSDEAATTPLQDGGEAFAAATSTTLSLLGPTADTPSPKQQNEGMLRSQSLDECFRRKLLFDSPEQKLAVSEIGAFGGMELTSSAIKKKEKEGHSSMEFTTKLSDSSSQGKYKSLTRNDTHTTVPLEESSFVSQQKSLHGGGRVFGSDAASRLNRQMEIERRNNRPNSSDDSTVKSTASSKSDYKKGGTHLSGISKWISLSFDMVDKACAS